MLTFSLWSARLSLRLKAKKRAPLRERDPDPSINTGNGTPWARSLS